MKSFSRMLLKFSEKKTINACPNGLSQRQPVVLALAPYLTYGFFCMLEFTRITCLGASNLILYKY